MSHFHCITPGEPLFLLMWSCFLGGVIVMGLAWFVSKYS
jgi:hypothetical protein